MFISGKHIFLFQGVIKRLDAIRRTLCGKAVKIPCKWAELTVCKKEGGLGIRNLKKQNQSLMMKWLLKFANEHNLIWKDVVMVKYGMEDNWMTKMVTMPYSCTVWRAIRNLWPLMHSNINIKVGNDLKHDKWTGNRPLKQDYPVLYTLCQQ